jgi:hypothetical protein
MRNNKARKQQTTTISYLKTLAEQAREQRVRYQKPAAK